MMILIAVALWGWIAGATVNYLSDVLPNRRRFSIPFCVNCKELQPLLNYLVWPRRCVKCKTQRSFRVWLVEGIYIFLSVWLWNSPPNKLGYLMGLVLLIYFGIVVIIDLEHRLILHPISLVGAIFCFGLGTWLHGLTSTLLGGAVGFAVMLFLYYLGHLFVRWMSRWRGQEIDEVALGYGDVNLSGVIGLLLGWPGISVSLVLTILLGGIASLLLLLIMLLKRQYRHDLVLPYGPFLVASAVILLFLRDYIIA